MNIEAAKQAARDTCGDDENSDEFKVAMILLASINVGPDEKKIRKLLGYPEDFVATVGKRMRRSGTWTKGGKVAANWADPERGGIAFALDVNVGLGFMERARAQPKSQKIGSTNNRP